MTFEYILSEKTKAMKAGDKTLSFNLCQKPNFPSKSTFISFLESFVTFVGVLFMVYPPFLSLFSGRIRMQKQ